MLNNPANIKKTIIAVEIKSRKIKLHREPYPRPLFGITLYSQAPKSKNSKKLLRNPEK